MKATGKCTKCHSRKITIVKGRSSTSHKLYYGRLSTKTEKFDTYICTRCGFSERYARLSDKFLVWARDNIIESVEEDNDFV